MRYLVVFSYDGTKFHGFQRQKDVKNVQGTLEEVLSDVLDCYIEIKGAGRTDAGVHATHQCAHFDYDKKIKYKDLKKINKMLNEEIIIKDLKKVNNNFHARHSVKKKTYIYKINTGLYDPKKEGYFYQIKNKFNMKDMKNTAKVLVGAHDYKNFVSGQREDYTSIIYDIKIKKKRKIITMEFTGVGFYRYMVRHLVGSILDVGKGNATVTDVKKMLDKPNMDKKLSVVPAEGLYLIKIKYYSFCQ